MNIYDVKQKITPILEEYGITYAGVFGSIARDDSSKDSDVDLLVHLGHPMGMFLYMEFINKLETSLQRKVDVVTEKSLNKRIKPYVESEIKTIYENLSLSSRPSEQRVEGSYTQKFINTL